MIQKKELREYAAIVLGAFIMGFAIKNIYDPANLVTGGVSGIAIIVNNESPITDLTTEQVSSCD